ncbi:hypothetical protein Tco_0819982 [Tanacetum coccineum]|uniref:Gag-Pol polyprotein n=1 Tax=Tanacetum coccineum TaxID=301880 RepID=A0ABQ5AC32_9ASTR
MLGPGRYSQWRSRFLRYIDTKPNGEGLRKSILSGPYVPSTVLVQAVAATEGNPAIQQHTTIETVLNMTPENKEHFLSEKEAIFLLLTGIGDDIYSTVDACKTANEMWIAIERLQQGESLNVQDVKTNLFWEFGKFTSRDGESMESYYSRFYKLMNELTRNNLQVTTMQVNVQFLQQLQPEWSRFVTVVKQSKEIDTISYHTLFDILKQYQNEVNDIRAERIAKSANPLALLAAAQPYSDNYYQAPKPQRSNATSSSTRPSASTRHKGKEIAKPVTPQSESVSEEDSDPEQAQRDKDMQKNLALLAKNKTKDTTLRYNNDNQSGQFGNQRTMTVTGTRETVGSPVVQQMGIQCFNYKGFGHYSKEYRKPKRVKDYTYHKEKIMMCKQAEQGVSLQAEQVDWLADTDEEINEQELEAHYSFMAKIQEVLQEESSSTEQPVEQVQNNYENNVFANERQHSENNTTECADERAALGIWRRMESNCHPDTSNICTNDKSVNQKLRKENDIDTMIEMGQTIKFFKNEFFITQSSDSNHSHVSTQMRKRIHGNQTLWLIKSTFEKAQSDKPCLYEIPYDTSDPANRFAPDGEDTVTLEKESRSKLDKDKVKPYNYTYQNSLYETFKPPSKAYLDQLERAKEIRKTMWRKTEKADFSNIYDLLLEECVSKDVTCSYLHSMSHLNANTELQCLYLHKVKECECLAQKLSKQTESVNKEVHNKLLKSFAKLEKHSISLELSLQHCKEQMKNNPVCKENASNVFRKEREQYHEIQDLKAQMQDKNMVINELKKLILVTKKESVNPVETRVIHTTSVSRPQLKSYQVKDKVVPNISQVKFTKKEVEDNHRISSISKKTKSVTACNDSSNSRTSNANAVCADCGKCVFNSDHDACVSRYLKDVNARTKKPKFAPIHVWRSDSRNSRSTGLLLECPQSQSFSRWSNSVYADLEVAFRKTTCFVIELQGNDLLTGSRGI